MLLFSEGVTCVLDSGFSETQASRRLVNTGNQVSNILQIQNIKLAFYGIPNINIECLGCEAANIFFAVPKDV